MQRENHFFRFRSCKATIFDLTDSAFLMENANDNVVRRCRRKEYSESPNKYLLTGARELSLFAFRLPNQLFLVYAPCCKQLTTIYSSGELLFSCCQLSGTLFGGISPARAAVQHCVEDSTMHWVCLPWVWRRDILAGGWWCSEQPGTAWISHIPCSIYWSLSKENSVFVDECSLWLSVMR